MKTSEENMFELEQHITNILNEIDEKNNKKINSKLDNITNRVEDTNKKLGRVSKKISELEKSGAV